MTDFNLRLYRQQIIGIEQSKKLYYKMSILTFILWFPFISDFVFKPSVHDLNDDVWSQSGVCFDNNSNFFLKPCFWNEVLVYV